ncbi:hypothetical protein M413DRAFT_32657 [Hebeloma cylindrosporum]|uniref:Uncharacterized protein n=1 Tax=Hebeloma cylindrosporum TaxID=76867 RepID=A0A0C2Y2D1_HEBCY|nr:hypothetical protein M413DRAFT_32657 [Hebeloma cylindrosporum h7]
MQKLRKVDWGTERATNDEPDDSLEFFAKVELSKWCIHFADGPIHEDTWKIHELSRIWTAKEFRVAEVAQDELNCKGINQDDMVGYKRRNCFDGGAEDQLRRERRARAELQFGTRCGSGTARSPYDGDMVKLFDVVKGAAFYDDC